MDNKFNYTWTRKCQECGHRQVAKEPSGAMTDSYRNSKCRKCKSEALDYGTSAFTMDAMGNWVRADNDADSEE